MFYTIYPLELMLEEEVSPPARVELSVGGRLIVAAQAADGGLTLERLLSTDPNDYLNPTLQPGATVPGKVE